MDPQLCQRITGHARVRTATSTKRFGVQLDDGRWEIMCDHPATWWISGRAACDRDLPAIARLRLDELATDPDQATTTLAVHPLNSPAPTRA